MPPDLYFTRQDTREDRSKVPAKDSKKKDEDLSDEDIALKQQLEVYVETIQNPNPVLQEFALESMGHEIRTSTSSMNSIPKPLKFLRPHYGALKKYYEEMDTPELKKLLADILSVLALTMSAEGERESLKYRLVGSEGDIGSWGHEYVRNLAGEIAQEYPMRQDEEEASIDDLMKLVRQIVAFHMKHNTESEAVDLLMEYLGKIFTSCDDLLRKKQLSYILARHGVNICIEKRDDDFQNEREALQYIVNNNKLSEGFLNLACDLEVMEPKSPEDIYKLHLLDGLPGANADTDLQDLAATFVNAFVNAGFGKDKLMNVPSETSSSGVSWVFKNKDHEKTSAAASLGMILQWNINAFFVLIDKLFYYDDNHVMAGALLGVGIFNCGVKNDFAPAWAILSTYIDNKKDPNIRIGAILGLGIAYAGSRNDRIRNKLTPILGDTKAPLDIIAFTAISLGLVYVGSSNEEVAQAIMFALMNRSESELGKSFTRFLPLGLGLLYLGKQDCVDAAIEVSKTFNKKIRNYCVTTLLSCAYAGTCNVLKVQSLLGYCTQHLEEDEAHQGPAVLGIAMIAMSEELSTEMAIRSLEHLLQYGGKDVRKAVPLALGLLCISNPKVNVMDTLSRLTHDLDMDVIMSAIISLGLIGAGTNNARIARMLLNLSRYFCCHPEFLFLVRIAQGLVHLGKGLVTLDPRHSDRFLIAPNALAGLTILMHCCLEMRGIILKQYHYCLYFVVLAMQPRMLMTVDENLKPLPVLVRVGQAVDVVGQAGQPKTITGFQTHTTPVLLAAGDRAELATDKYLPLSPILEGFVVLRLNPDYREDS